MMTTKLKIRYYGDPCLVKKSSPVQEAGSSERMLAKAMVETMYEHKGVGLAAPQVGINERMFVADVGDGPMVFIDPEIVKSSGSEEMEEGCLSIPEVMINVTRPDKIVVRYTDLNNKRREKKFKELLARVIQHETDHLNGKLIIDYASVEELEKYSAQLKKLEEKNCPKPPKNSPN